MRKHTLGFAALTAACVLASGPSWAAEKLETVVDAPLNRLSLFKNGISVAERIVTPPKENGPFLVNELISPVHGTVWVDSKEFANLMIRTVTRKWACPNENPFGNLTNTYLGKDVVLVYSMGNEQTTTIKGTVVNPLPDVKRTKKWQKDYSSRPTPYYYSYQPSVLRPSEPGMDFLNPESPFLTLKTSSGELTAIQKSRILRIDCKELNADVQMERRALLFQPMAGKTLSEPMTLSYLTKGITWSPSYRVKLGPDFKMKLQMATTITNELTNFKNVEINLISGFPNVQFGNVLSPLAPGVTIASFIQSLQQMTSGVSGGVATQQILFNQAVDGNALSRGKSDSYELMQGSGVPENIQYYSVGRLSMEEGETVYLPLAEAETSYESIVEWTIPDRRGWNGRIERRNSYSSNPDQENQFGILWDSIRFKNPFKTAMTTAPIEVMEGGKLLGQATSFWTNPGQESLVKITKALTVVGKIVENEIPSNRPEVRIYGYTFISTDASGTITLKNYRNVDSQVLVKLRFAGKLSSADGNPKKELLTSYNNAVNEQNELTWELKLKAGEEQKLQYKYTVLVSH